MFDHHQYYIMINTSIVYHLQNLKLSCLLFTFSFKEGNNRKNRKNNSLATLFTHGNATARKNTKEIYT